MTKLVHTVYVHPLENGEPNSNKVELTREFETKEAASLWITIFNGEEVEYENEVRAVYHGCVNDESGELV